MAMAALIEIKHSNCRLSGWWSRSFT